MAKRKRRLTATRNVVLFASAVLCLAGLIAFVGTRKPTQIMPPETQEQLVMRRSADNAYSTLMDAVKLLPKKPLALPVPDAEFPALQVAYKPKSGSLGEILDIMRPDDDPELTAYLEQCGPAMDKTREALAKPYYRLPIIWSEYRLLDFRNSWMNRGEARFKILGNAMIARAVQAVRAGGDGAQAVATLLDVVRLGQLMATDGTIEDTPPVQQHAVWWIGEAASSLNRESLVAALKETLKLESTCDVSVSSLEHHWRILDNTQSLETRFSGVTDITERIHFGIQLREVRKLVSEHREEFRQAVLMDASQFKNWPGAHSEWRHKAYPMICPVEITNRIVYTMNDLRTRYRTAELSLALELYRADHSEYPSTLDPPAPRYLEKLPYDPVTGASFQYFREGSDYWIFRGKPGPDGRPESARGVFYGPEELVAKLKQR